MPSHRSKPKTPGPLPLALAAALLAPALLAPTLLTGCGRRGRRRTPAPVPTSPRVDTSRDAARDAWQKPALIVKKMGLQPGMSVVDMGSGSGYLLPHLSRAVGPKGRVFAVEVDDTLITALKRRIKRAKLSNVVVIKGAVGDLPLSTLVDRIVLLNTYPELERPVAMLEAMRLRLKPTGRLVIIDYKTDETVPGPPPEERLSLDTIVAEARGAGFVESLQFDVLPRQYFAMFINSEETESGDDSLDPPTTPTPTTDETGAAPADQTATPSAS